MDPLPTAILLSLVFAGVLACVELYRLEAETDRRKAIHKRQQRTLRRHYQARKRGLL